MEVINEMNRNGTLVALLHFKSKVQLAENLNQLNYVRGADGWKSDFVRFRGKNGPILTF